MKSHMIIATAFVTILVLGILVIVFKPAFTGSVISESNLEKTTPSDLSAQKQKGHSLDSRVLFVFARWDIYYFLSNALKRWIKYIASANKAMAPA